MGYRKLTALFFLILIVTPINAAYKRKEKISDEEKESVFECLRNQLAKAALTGTFTTLSSFILAKMSLWMAGFSSIGPVAGSLAAWIQSMLGNVVASSIFAFLQSIAMGKLSLLLGPAVLAGATVGIIYWIASCITKETLFHNESDSDNSDSWWGKFTDSIQLTYELSTSIYAHIDFFYQVTEYAIHLLKKEFYDQQQFDRKPFENRQQCKIQDTSPNNIDEFFLHFSE